MSSYEADPREEEIQLLKQLRASKGGVVTNHSAALAIANRLVRNGWAYNKVLDGSTKTILLWNEI